jgi:hypothetical protein
MNKFSMILLSAGVLVACGGDECEKAADRMEAVMADCGIDNTATSSTTGTATGTTEAECTEEDGAGMSCMADCYEAADCAGVDGSDLDAALELGGCMLECMMTSTGGSTGTTSSSSSTTTTTTGT